MATREYGRTVGRVWNFDGPDCDSLKDALRLAVEDAQKEGILPTSFILTAGPRPWVLNFSWYAQVEDEE